MLVIIEAQHRDYLVLQKKAVTYEGLQVNLAEGRAHTRLVTYLEPMDSHHGQSRKPPDEEPEKGKYGMSLADSTPKMVIDYENRHGRIELCIYMASRKVGNRLFQGCTEILSPQPEPILPRKPNKITVALLGVQALARPTKSQSWSPGSNTVCLHQDGSMDLPIECSSYVVPM